MAGEMLYLANLGVEILRLDAVAFTWKRLGTTCESQPEAHRLVRAFNALCRIAAPALVFKSEAIVHPDEVISYVSTGEAQLSYNPLLMALSWEALATRDATLLAQAVARRQGLPAGCSWVNYVRCHDDIGWTFADEDAAELGIDGGRHRRFLNAFYVARHPASFARGLPFQDNPKTGDCRIAGTCASLAGIEAGDEGGVDRVILLHAVALASAGVPLLYLGDEVGQLNDLRYVDDPALAGDSRWAHRPFRPDALYEAAKDPATDAGAISRGLARLVEARKSAKEFAGQDVVGFDAGERAILAFLRPGDGSSVLALCNFADEPRHVAAARFSAFAPASRELVAGRAVDLSAGLDLPAHGVAWLRLAPRTERGRGGR
ncbi:MAG: amylosucrase, partial [Hyphomicrobiales bacterium]|nr:amylosucrase [Hyphomicrobiales bacterium]